MFCLLLDFWRECAEVLNRKFNEFTSSGSCLFKSFHHELLGWTGLFCRLTSWILFLSIYRLDAWARITLLMPNYNDFTNLNFRNDRKSIWCSNNNGENLVEDHKEILKIGYGFKLEKETLLDLLHHNWMHFYELHLRKSD